MAVSLVAMFADRMYGMSVSICSVWSGASHDDRIPLLSTGRHRAILFRRPVTTEYERSPFNMTRDNHPYRVLHLILLGGTEGRL